MQGDSRVSILVEEMHTLQPGDDATQIAELLKRSPRMRTNVRLALHKNNCRSLPFYRHLGWRTTFRDVITFCLPEKVSIAGTGKAFVVFIRKTNEYMRRSQSTDRSEEESRNWLDRARGKTAGHTGDDSRNVSDRARSEERVPDDSGNWFDRKRGRAEEQPEEESGSWFDRAKAKYGFGALLAAAGVVLFLFPEPVTSTAGLVLIGVGALIWLVSWL